MQKWLQHNDAALQQSHPVWGHQPAAATQAARVQTLQVKRRRVATCRTHVGGVDGLQAAEDVMKLWGSELQVWEVLSPASSQKLLTAELQGHKTLPWWCETFRNVGLLLKLEIKLLNCFSLLFIFIPIVLMETQNKSQTRLKRYHDV